MQIPIINCPTPIILYKIVSFIFFLCAAIKKKILGKIKLTEASEIPAMNPNI
jgi:hypothetical protein